MASEKVVTDCCDCPFCGLVDDDSNEPCCIRGGSLDPDTFAVPEDCPLRTGPVVVRLRGASDA